MAKTHNAYKGEKPQRQPKLLMRDGFTVGYELREQAVPETMINAEGKVVPYVPKFPDSIKGSFAAYKANTKTLLKASLYFLIFLAPMIVLLVYGYNALLAHYTYSGGNFMGNLGIGYPGEISDIHSIMLTLYNGYQMFLFYCVPAVFIISLGMAGLFNVAKKVIWNEPIKYVAKPFFDGIKRFWWKYVIFVMVGAGVLLAMGSSLIYLLGEIEMSRAGAGAYCACIFSFIIGAPILLYCLVPLTIIPSYKLSFVQLIKDSFIMLVNRFVPYLIMAAVCGGEVETQGAAPENLGLLLHKLRENGCKIGAKNDKIRMYEKSKIAMYKHTFFFVYFFRRYTKNGKINYTIKDIERNEFKTKLFSFS